MRYSLKTILIFVIYLALSGCGGSESDSGPSLSLDTTSLTFTAQDGGTTPASQYLSARVNNLDRTIYAGVTYSTNGLNYVSYSFGTDTINMTVQPKSPITLSPGDYTDEIVIVACEDQTCSRHIAGSPKTVTVHYSVVASIGVGQSELTFSYIYGSNDLPQDQMLSIIGSDIPWSVAADQSWVILGTESGSGPADVSVGINPAGLEPGTYTSTISVTETDTNRTIPVVLTFTVIEPTLSFDVESLGFAGINGAPIDIKTANLTMNNGQTIMWTATPSADWIVIGDTSETSPMTLNIGVDPSITPLASGSYTGVVSVTGTYDGITLSDTLNVSLDLTRAEFTVSPASVTLGGTYGLDFSNATLTTSLNTGANTYPWTAVLNSSQNWLIADKVFGANANGEIITLDADRSDMVQGIFSGSIAITTQINGDTLSTSVPVTLNLSAHELVPSDVGIAFTSTPSNSALTATISVSDTYGFTDTPWSASSDQTWLTVTETGSTSDAITVTADPTGLSLDSTHYAVITLASSDVSIENSPTIRVALWKGSADPTAISSAVAYTHVQTDPIRPYAYVHNGGDSITVRNVYTGGVVNTWTSIGTTLGAMTVSDDGTYLYVVDTSNANVVIVDLDTGEVTNTIAVGSNTALLTYARPAGHPILIAGDGQVYDGLTGDNHGALSNTSGRTFGTSADGKNVCALNMGYSPWSLSCHTLGYSSLGTGAVVSLSSRSLRGDGGNGKDVALNADGSRVYVASGAPYSFTVLDGADLSYLESLTGAAYPNNVEIASNGTVVGAANVWYGPYDLWVYDESGAEVSKQYLSGYAKSIRDRQVHISGDGRRIVVLTDDPAVKMISMP